MLLPKNPQLVEKIKETAKKGLPIAELEYLGLSLRVINSLEESVYKIVYLEDLLGLTTSDLNSIENLGVSGLKQISMALHKLDSLENEKNKWHRKF